SAEREHVRLDSSRAELDLEGAVADRIWPADQLVQAGPGDGSAAGVVYVETTVEAGRLSVDAHLEWHGCALLPDAQNKVDVARLEAEGDGGARPVRHARPRLERPLADERPLVEAQR